VAARTLLVAWLDFVPALGDARHRKRSRRWTASEPKSAASRRPRASRPASHHPA
jgi:hypothetical protein